MLSHWGQELFCFWAIILSVRAIVLFLSDGYLRYVVNQYNLLYHTDESAAARVLSAGISFLIVLSLLLCGFVAVAFLLFPSLSSFVFDTDKNVYTYLPLCLLAYLPAACVQNIQRLYAATKEVKGLVWHNMVVEVLLVACELLALSLLLLQDYDFNVVVFADSGMIILVAIMYSIHLYKQYPLYAVLAPQSIREGAVQFKKATKLYASNFFEKLSTDGLVLLLSFFRFDKAAIALFATVRTIVNTPLLAQNLLLNTYTPELQKQIALRTSSSLEQLLSFIRLRLGLFFCLGILCCLPFYQPLFSYWTKGEIKYDKYFMVTMLIMAVFNLYGLSITFILKGVNALPQLLRLMLLKTVLLVIGFVWAQQDILNTAIVLALVELLSSIFISPMLLNAYRVPHQLRISISKYYLQFVPYLLTILLLLVYIMGSYLFDFKLDL